MNNSMAMALALAAGLFTLGIVTGAVQIRGLRTLKTRKHVPSDEASYLRNRYRRRLLTALVLMCIGWMIAGAYLSGMEREADALAAPKVVADDQDPDAPKPPPTDEQKQFVRFWGVYWIVVVVLVFGLLGLALTDAIATRRYWFGIYREMRDEHQAKLRRDLAVYKQQQEHKRGGISGNKLGDAGE